MAEPVPMFEHHPQTLLPLSEDDFKLLCILSEDTAIPLDPLLEMHKHRISRIDDTVEMLVERKYATIRRVNLSKILGRGSGYNALKLTQLGMLMRLKLRDKYAATAKEQVETNPDETRRLIDLICLLK